MRDVVGVPGGLVAVGHAATGESIDAAVWTSADGTNWNRTAFGGPGHEEMLSATTFHGEIVAVGYGTAPGEDRDAAVWIESGGTWSGIPDDSFGGAGYQQMNSVVAGGPGLVAVGSDDSGGDIDASVWTSTEGRTWTRAPAEGAVFGGPGAETMTAVITVGSALITAG